MEESSYPSLLTSLLPASTFPARWRDTRRGWLGCCISLFLPMMFTNLQISFPKNWEVNIEMNPKFRVSLWCWPEDPRLHPFTFSTLPAPPPHPPQQLVLAGPTTTSPHTPGWEWALPSLPNARWEVQAGMFWELPQSSPCPAFSQECRTGLVLWGLPSPQEICLRKKKSLFH